MNERQEIFYMLISPEHAQLKEKYQQLMLRNMQFEKVVEKKDADIKLLQSKFTPLSNRVDKLAELAKQQAEENESLRKIIKEKDQLLQKYELLQFQFEQLTRLMQTSTSERFVPASVNQLALDMSAETVEACAVNDGKRIEAYTKHKAAPKKHPGRNQLPAHLPRTYVDMYPENLPEGAVLVETIESEQLEYNPGKLFSAVAGVPEYWHKLKLAGRAMPLPCVFTGNERGHKMMKA